MFIKPADVFMRRARILEDPPEGVSVVAISEFLTAKPTPYCRTGANVPACDSKSWSLRSFLLLTAWCKHLLACREGPLSSLFRPCQATSGVLFIRKRKLSGLAIGRFHCHATKK